MDLLNISLPFNLDFSSLLMVIFVDLVLSGDNAIVIGMAAATLPPTLRQKAIIWGIAIAVVLRIVLAALTVYLLKLTGIKLLGSLMLIAVCYMMWKDLANKQSNEENSGNKINENTSTSKEINSEDSAKTIGPSTSITQTSSEYSRAMLKIIIADVTMSLDNVLAVAAIAREDIFILIFGLALSIVLMAVGANMVAKLLEKYSWLGYVGLLIIFWVALKMGYDGSREIFPLLNITI